jgi:hypothetical protein
MLAQRLCPWAEGNLNNAPTLDLPPIHVLSFLGAAVGPMVRSAGSSRALNGTGVGKRTMLVWGMSVALPMQYLRDLAAR